MLCNGMQRKTSVHCIVAKTSNLLWTPILMLSAAGAVV